MFVERLLPIAATRLVTIAGDAPVIVEHEEILLRDYVMCVGYH